MNFPITPLLRIVVAIPLCAGVAVAADPCDELKPFQGVWVIAEAHLAGRDHRDDFHGMKLTITGNTYVIDFGDNSDKGTITVDGTKTPKHIDLTTRPDGPFKGRTLPGIYEFHGQRIRLCLNSEKPERPTKFEAPEKTPLMLLTFQRPEKQ
ncbi:MAG: TIGR03067 domain-containing protein [Gemmataceae bacterium]|nr:TIGR03067 domain-containing protein [Gemmata sp.]MDW8196237.1 TIGR03067 domain-containing protein [Gemmataceae bacterium]